MSFNVKRELTADMDRNKNGFWSSTSSMDWCEENYTVSPFIAEWWNTLTNLNYILLSLVGFWSAYQTKSETRTYFLYLAALAIGLGSFAFHMTLTYEMQLSDELPMIFGTAFHLYCGINIFRSSNVFSIIILSVVSMGIIVHYLVTFDFAFFETAFMMMLIAGGLFPLYHIWTMSKTHPGHSRQLLRLFGLVYFGYIFGYTLWNIDNLKCEELRAVRDKVGVFSFLFQFHGWWHLFTGLGAFTSDTLVQYMRLIVLGRKGIMIKWLGPYPVVVAKSKGE
ncbi:ceramidase [Globomyces pollinis-pini]|nr:ceramidase [Globomyces pollinis-pini]